MKDMFCFDMVWFSFGFCFLNFIGSLVVSEMGRKSSHYFNALTKDLCKVDV